MIRTKVACWIALFVLICGGWGVVAAADQPLTKDDVRLLLIGGASPDKMKTLIEQRGVDFQMTPDLAKKFHDDGATDEIIEVLQRAGQKAASNTASSTGKSDTTSGR